MIDFLFSLVRMDVLLRPVRVLAAIAALDGSKSILRFIHQGIILIIVVSAVIIRQMIKSVHESSGFIIETVEFVCYNFRVPWTFCSLLMAYKNVKQIEDFLAIAGTLNKKFEIMGFPVDYSSVKRQGQIFVGLLVSKYILQQTPLYMQGKIII